MITKTVNLDSSYDALFQEIKALSTSKHNDDPNINIIDINSLEGFYGHIEEIAALDPKFLRLPLDEPLFDIDANTRKIEIPADFRSNGVSVQRDHLAEVIYFRIARFFDYTDLNTCQIVINWKMGNREGKTTRFIKFPTVMVEPDETKTDCLIFGWPIDEVVTEKSGVLQFAIEFYKELDNELTYRFNTLAANINIKDGLVVSDEIVPTSLEDSILRSLINSSFGEGEAAVGDIQWLTGNGHGLVTGAALDGTSGTIISFNPNDWQAELNLDTIIDNENNPVSIHTNLIAEAFVDNQTTIRYTDNAGNRVADTFVKVSESRILVEDRDNLDPNQIYYIGNGPDAVQATEEQLSDESINLYMVAPLNKNLIYYIQTEEDPVPAYNKASEEDISAWGTASQKDLYSKIAVIDVDKAGSYLLKAQGEKWIQIPDPNDAEQLMDQKIGAGEVSTTDIVVVPAAKAPEAISIIAADELPEFKPVDENYSIDPSYENVIFIPDEGRNIKVIAEFENRGAVQFIWQRKGINESDTAFVNVSSEESLFKLADEDLLENAEEGVYCVHVKNFINNTVSDEVISDNYTLSKLATPIESADRMYVAYTSQFPQGRDTVIGNSVSFYPRNSSFSKRQVELKVGNIVPNLLASAEDIRSTEIKYIWERSFDEEAIENPTAVHWEQISTDPSITVNVEGIYRVKIQNVYNGSVYTKILDPFNVNAMGN